MTMSNDFSFNLISEPWIPCVLLEGKIQEMGLLDTLVYAHNIQEVSDPSPLVTASLHRLLLAILHRNFGPESIDDWKSIWNIRQFDEKALQEYFGKWRDRFDLFGKEYPFYQVKEFPAKSKDAPAALLKQELAGGNNATLFDHTWNENLPAFSAAECVRFLASYHFYTLGGLSGLGRNFTDGVTARQATILIRGKNLFETLCLNLIRYDDIKPIASNGTDKPVWEMSMPEYTHTTPMGYLDYLTWQSRTIKLIPEKIADNTVGVNMIQIGLGRELHCQLPIDPLTSWRTHKKMGWMSHRFDEGKALWRDSTALFRQLKNDTRNPGSIEWLSELKYEDVLSANLTYTLDAIGLGTDQAKIDFWRHERMPLPLVYLGNDDLISELGISLDRAEKGAGALSAAFWSLASNVLAPGERQPDKNDIRNYVNHLAGDNLYWSRLEEPFYRFLVDLPKDREAEQVKWSQTVIKTARDAFEEIVRDLDRSARMYKARVMAGNALNGKLKPLYPETEEEEND
jgi:CRISPR system Cascade subunit CasA